MASTNNDCYPIAAVRHFEDGLLLQQHGRNDNAMCHYAFSGECSIKAFLSQLELNSRSHTVPELLDNVTTYAELVGLMHPKFALLLGVDSPPTALFDGHPERRYAVERPYTIPDLQNSQLFCKDLIHRLVIAVVNGQIDVPLH